MTSHDQGLFSQRQGRQRRETLGMRLGFHMIAPVTTIAAVMEKRVSAIYGNTPFSDSSDSGDDRR